MLSKSDLSSGLRRARNLAKEEDFVNDSDGCASACLEAYREADPPEAYAAWLHGVALCLVDVVGCRPLVADDEPLSWYWDPTGDRGEVRYAWELANLRRVAPFAVKGRQGFARTVPRADVEKALSLWSAS